MRPTIPYIESKFREFNRRYFDGCLPPIPFRLSNARSFLGKISFRTRLLPDGRRRYYDFLFHISARLDRPEEIIEDTILHEMIHYRILSAQEQDTAPHGELFRAWMNHLNSNHGRHITIRHHTTEEEHTSDTEIRQHWICILLMADGRTGIAPCARSRVFQLWDTFANNPAIIKSLWVTTSDPWFNRFPRTRTPKFYPLPSSDMITHLSDSRLLIREPGIIRVSTANPDLSFLKK